ncbi:MAG: ABC transporter permease subunit [Jatrophihabitans sp.]
MSHPEPIPARAAPSSGSAGVIHDIGYRTYVGRRLGRGYVLRSLYLNGVRSTFGLGRTARAKVLPLLLLVATLLPAVIIVAIEVYAKADVQPISYNRYAMILIPVVAIFVASQAPQLISRDLRFRTVTLYFSRPLTREDYVVAKFGALASALFILLSGPIVILAVGGVLAKFPLWEQTKNFASAEVGAVAFALLLTAVSAVLASGTTRRGLGVAVIITVLFVSYAGTVATQGIAHFYGNDTLAGYLGLLSPFTMADGVQIALVNAPTSTAAGPPETTGELVFVLVAAALVAGCFALLLRRYRKPGVL